MKQDNIPYAKQIFVCTNDRKGEKPSCGDHGKDKGEAIFTELRRMAKERGIHPKVRVAQAKCLGQCHIGTNIMIYPDSVWYSHVRLEDLPEIIDKHFSDPSP